VRVKKAQKPARSIRYLLCVDRTLQRISLRRISVRVKKANNLSRSGRTKKNAARETNRSRNAALVMNAWRSLRALDPRAIAFVVIGVVALAALIGAPRLFQSGDPTSVAVQPDDNAPRGRAALASRLDTRKVAGRPTAGRAHTTDASTASTRAVEPATAEPTANADVADPAVTITGCLEVDDDAFWLKETSGTDAPKSRSWKSGFFRKRSASVEVVDETDALKLSNYVGQRVAATGTLADRRMQAHSLRRVSASCN
jgi:hypothetical protein